MSTLVLFFALTRAGTWEFFALQHAGNPAYCEMLKEDVARAFNGKPGNQKIVCLDDEGVEA
jgi:hypothetical protein